MSTFESPGVNTFTDIPAPFSTFRHDRTPYVLHWNFNVQRRIAKNTSIEVAYQGAESHKLWKRFNNNQAVPDLTGRIPIQLRVPYPAFQAGLLTSGRDANRVYNAASIKLERAFSGGLLYQSVYSFSRMLSDWQAQGIVVILTGFPFTPTANSVHITGSFIPQFADRIADGNLPHDQRSPTRWFDIAAFARPAIVTFGSTGRNVLIGPGVGNLDFSLIKDTLITERVKLQLRAESFNLFNHPLFNNPDGNVDNRTLGQISAAGDPRRLQFALKLLF